MIAKPGGSKKKEDGVFDLEQQFILRLPPGPAMALKHDVQSGVQNLKDKLSVEIQSDQRRGRVIYGGQMFSTKLVDLPCIIESLKTTDKKTFYKTADICQMLICTTDDEEPDEVDSMKKKEKDKKYQWNHGICTSLKNVRKRRFRKTLEKKYQEQPDIEKEVKQLFSQDNEAINVKWEVAYEETNQDVETVEKQGTKNNNAILDETINDSNEILAFGEQEIFGDVSSSDEDVEREVNVMDSGDELTASSSLVQVDSKECLLDYTINETQSSEPDISIDLQSRLEEVHQQLEELREKRVAKETIMSIVENTSSRDALQSELQIIIEEESTKEKEFAILNSVFGNS